MTVLPTLSGPSFMLYVVTLPNGGLVVLCVAKVQKFAVPEILEIVCVIFVSC